MREAVRFELGDPHDTGDNIEAAVGLVAEAPWACRLCFAVVERHALLISLLRARRVAFGGDTAAVGCVVNPVGTAVCRNFRRTGCR